MRDRDRMKDLLNDMEKAIGATANSTEKKYLVELTEREMALIIVSLGQALEGCKKIAILHDIGCRFARMVPEEVADRIFDEMYKE